MSQNLLAIRQAAGDPALEDVAALGTFGSVDDDASLALARADEEDQAAVLGYFADDFGGAPEVGCGHVQGDDVYTLADAEDVFCVCWVPEGGGVAEVGLRGEEEVEGYVFDTGRVCD